MESTTSFSDRIKYLQKYFNTKTEDEFANILGVKKHLMRHYRDKGVVPGLDKMKDILLSVEGLSADWLIMGKGKPFPEKEETKAVFEPSENYNRKDTLDRDAFIEMKVKYEFMEKEYEYLKGELSKTTETIMNLSASGRKKNTAGSA